MVNNLAYNITHVFLWSNLIHLAENVLFGILILNRTLVIKSTLLLTCRLFNNAFWSVHLFTRNAIIFARFALKLYQLCSLDSSCRFDSSDFTCILRVRQGTAISILWIIHTRFGMIISNCAARKIKINCSIWCSMLLFIPELLSCHA